MKAPPELVVFLRLGEMLVALSAKCVRQLVLAEDAVVLREGTSEKPALVEGAGAAYAGWDLGELLGLDATEDAWVLMEIPHGGEPLRIALRTGPCFGVGVMPDASPLPRALFDLRSAAFVGAFAANAVRSSSVYGLIMDPARLLTRAELEASVELQRGVDA